MHVSGTLVESSSATIQSACFKSQAEASVARRFLSFTPLNLSSFTMPFSLYGDLPEPSSDKSNTLKNSPTTTSGSSLSGLYASLPAPGASSSATATTAPTTSTTPSPTTSTTTPIQSTPETSHNAPTSSSAPTTGVKPAGIQGDYHTQSHICFSRLHCEIFHYEMDLMPTDILSMCAM